MAELSRNGPGTETAEQTPEVPLSTAKLVMSRILASAAMLVALPFAIIAAIALWFVILVSIWTEK